MKCWGRSFTAKTQRTPREYNAAQTRGICEMPDNAPHFRHDALGARQEILGEHAPYASAADGFDGGDRHGNELTVILQGDALLGP